METKRKWRFQAVTEYFEDYAACAAPSPFSRLLTQPRLGLKRQQQYSGAAHNPNNDDDKDAVDWTRFIRHVEHVNQQSCPNVAYKVVFITRHGVGFHNQKHAAVGDSDWESRWSYLNGDGETEWFDSFLTEKGIEQAKCLSDFWKQAVAQDGVPIPDTLYTSPLARCLQTTQHAFADVLVAHNRRFRPIVKEALRERNTLHTCDFRRPRSWIASSFPHYAIHDDVAEHDPFQQPGRAEETDKEHCQRKQAALEEIFDNNPHHVISLTVHWFAIMSLLKVCNLAFFKVAESTSFALLVRGERIEASIID